MVYFKYMLVRMCDVTVCECICVCVCTCVFMGVACVWEYVCTHAHVFTTVICNIKIYILSIQLKMATSYSLAYIYFYKRCNHN